MFLLFVIFFLFLILSSSLTTIPLSIIILVVCAVIFRESWVFFAAFLLGLYLDLMLIRPLGYTSLMFTIFVFLIRLYERKFETQTLSFVLLSSFLGSLVYLMIFEYNNVLFQSLINSFLAVLFFKLWLRLGLRSEII